MSRRKRHCRRQRTATFQMEPLETRTLLAADMGVAAEATESLAMDVNGDGAVSAHDALLVLNAMLNPESTTDEAVMDVNADGSLSPLDALMILNVLQRPQASVPDPVSGDPSPERAAGPRGAGENGDSPGTDSVRPGAHRPGGEPVPGGAPGGHPAGRPGGRGLGGPGENSDGNPSGGPGGTRFIRSIDGTDNNPRFEEWGSTDEPLQRISPNDYADGESSPAGEDRISAREVSNLVAAQTELVENDRGLSDLVWQWGQFIDHDIDLTDNADPAEPFPISVPAGDPYFDPFGTGTEEIGFNRSIYETNADGVRQQTNEITAFIDGSNVYGSDEERAAALRSFEGGKLKTSDGDLLPFNEDGLANAGGTDDNLFLAGDIRANEQIGLTAMHTLWVREHNRIADQLAEYNPQASDEQLYQRARAIVIAEMQAITYNEFLPALLGEDAIPQYRGYDRSVNAGITNEFSTAAYRFGHSMLSPELLRLNNDGTVADEGPIALQDAFFRPDEIAANGIDSIIFGQASQAAQEIDTMLVDDVRNFLFGPPGSGGFDLASLNIQRGRDHGLADYNQVRTDLGLDPVQSFAEISSNPDVQAALEAAYGSVDNIDLWVGGLAEDHVAGSSVGELVQAVLVDQFTRLRDGDRFWYQEVFSGRELRRIENTTLADVIQRNTGIDNLQESVFFIEQQATPPTSIGVTPLATMTDGNGQPGSTGMRAELVVRQASGQTQSGDRPVPGQRPRADRVRPMRQDHPLDRMPTQPLFGNFANVDEVFAQMDDVDSVSG